MRSIPSALQARLDGGVTTLARCWIVRRRDGATFGFTDHDNELVVDGVVCRVQAGLSVSEVTNRFGMNVDAADIAGALSDVSLSEAELAAGKFDAADVETWLIDWSEPTLNLMLGRAVLGEVTREGGGFRAELRSIKDALAQEKGRVMALHCSADLGDARCQVDLNAPGLSGVGIVAALTGTSSFTADGLGAFGSGLFSAGALVWTSGANTALACEIKVHLNEAGLVTLALWQAMPEPIAPGDAFSLSAGCDKRFATCRERFANSINFRGFPHMPGNDFLMRYPISGEPGHTGASLQGEK